MSVSAVSVSDDERECDERECECGEREYGECECEERESNEHKCKYDPCDRDNSVIGQKTSVCLFFYDVTCLSELGFSVV